MAGNPPRLELDLSSNSTSSFKRSFDQLNIDIDSSIGEDSIGGSNNASGSADSGGSERNKRARSESGSSYVDSPSFLSDSAGPSSARSLASTASNSLTVPTDTFTAVASSGQLSPLREDSPPLGLALQNVGILPVTMEGVVSDAPSPPSGSAHATASLMSSSATQENDQFSRLSLERFNEFERNISALRHSDDPVPGPTLPLPARPPFMTDATADSPAIPDQPRSTIEGHLDNLADFAEYPESSYSFTHMVHSGHRDIASPPVLPDILPPSPFRDLDDLSWFNDGPSSNSGRESADHGAGSLSVQPSMSSTMVQESPVSSASSHSSVPNLLGHVRALGRVRMALAPVPAPPGTEDLLTANLDSPALREGTQHTYNRSRPPQIPASARSELFLPPSDTLDSTDAYGRDRISPEEALSRLEEIERSLERYLSAGLPGVEPAQGASHRLLGMQRRLSSYSGLLGTNSRIPPPTGPRGPHVVNEQNGPCETREIALIRRFIIELRVIARQMARLRATENAIRNVLESGANASATADNTARQPVTNANRSQRPDPSSTSWRPTSWRPQTSSAADFGARDLARYRYNTGPGPSTSLVSESAAERRRMLAQEAISRGLDAERSNIREIFDRLVSPTIPEHPIPSMGGYSASFATRSEQARGTSNTNDASRRGSQRGTDERRDSDQLADWYWNTPHLPSADRQREESRPGRGVPSAWREITHTDFFDDDFVLGQADRREDVGPSHVVPSTNNAGPPNTTEDGFIWDVISDISPNTAAASGARSAEASFRTTSRPSSVTSDADYGYVHRAAASREQPHTPAADTASVSRFEDWDGSMASYVMRRSRSSLEATSRRRQDTLARLRSMREELGEQNAPAVSFSGNARSEEGGNGYDFQDVSATIRNERAERRSSFSVNVFGSSPQQTPQQPSASRSTHSVMVQAGGAPEERASPSTARRYVVANIDAYHDGPFRAALERSNQSVRRRPGFEGSRPPSLPPLRFQRNSVATASSVDSRPLPAFGTLDLPSSYVGAPTAAHEHRPDPGSRHARNDPWHALVARSIAESAEPSRPANTTGGSWAAARRLADEGTGPWSSVAASTLEPSVRARGRGPERRALVAEHLDRAVQAAAESPNRTLHSSPQRNEESNSRSRSERAAHDYWSDITDDSSSTRPWRDAPVGPSPAQSRWSRPTSRPVIPPLPYRGHIPAQQSRTGGVSGPPYGSLGLFPPSRPRSPAGIRAREIFRRMQAATPHVARVGRPGEPDAPWVSSEFPQLLNRFGTLRSTRSGDYVRDGDLDTSYEGLLRLSTIVGEARPRGTSAQIVSSLPSGVYRDWAIPGESEERCPICLDDYQQEDPVLKVTDCSHWFHKACLEQWLKGARTCPVCRGTVRCGHHHSERQTGPSQSQNQGQQQQGSSAIGSSGTMSGAFSHHLAGFQDDENEVLIDWEDLDPTEYGNGGARPPWRSS